MLDSKFIRENLDLVKEGARKKRIEVDIDGWVLIDEKRKSLQLKLDERRAEQNKASSEIAKASPEERPIMIAKVSEIKTDVQKMEEKQKNILLEWSEILNNIPNPPSPDMPEGKDDSENVEISRWGEIANFDFPVKDHALLGSELGIIDLEKAAEVSGSRFYYLKGDAVLLQFAIVSFVFETLGNEKIIEKLVKENELNISTKTFEPMLPPTMIRNEVQAAIHRVFGDQTYKIEKENLNLVASAEHTMAPYFMGETLGHDELPKRFIGYSTAYRREAGTYGKDMGGILRTHQFDKLEMESFTDAETGMEEQKLIVALQKYMVEKLGVPYRLVQVCTGDTGKPDYQQFDIECWIPSQETYRETHTSDYMTDYQMRGVKSFYKKKDGERHLLHTNDATAFAIGRILIAILENNQTVEGEVVIPEVLRKYMSGRERIVKK